MDKHVSKQSVRVLSAWVLALFGFVGAHAQAQTLRVCTDPDNLPFSKAEGPERGLYVELAERVAQRLKRSVEYVWYDSSYQRRALRSTIQANLCDAYFALPEDAEYRARGLMKSMGFLHVGYVVVARAGLAFAKLDDLKGMRVAVQYASTPAVLLSSIDGVTLVTHRRAPEALDSLRKGEADVAFVWGPHAGYDLQRHHSDERWQLTMVTGHGLGGSVSVAVRRDQPELAKAIDQALQAMKADIEALAVKYGFPRGKPVELGRITAPQSSRAFARRDVPHLHTAAWHGAPAAWHTVADAPAHASKSSAAKATKLAHKKDGSQSGTITSVAQVSTSENAAWTTDPATAAGREKFNDICAHCHSSDGASPIRERDLRRMKMRYDDQWVDTALKTINEGRPDLGMPTWKDKLKEDEIERIVAFLKTIQK